MPLLIGLDLGTTNCKAVAYSPDAGVLASASRDYPLLTPQPGWGEQDPADVWSGVVESLRELVQRLPASASPDGLCLSGAMHSLLPAAGNGEPLANAMSWADIRSAPQAAAFHRQGDMHPVYLRTGCPVQYLYYPAKIRWWLEEAPEIGRKAGCFAAIKDWVLFRLTGQWATDYGVASATGLLDIHELHWQADALALAGIPADRLPRLTSPTEIVGGLLTEVAQAVGLPAGLPVVAGSCDGGLANLGAGAAQDGESVITVGTSGAVRRVSSHPFFDDQERTWCYMLAEQRWFAGGAVNNGGLALQWALERFYPELDGSGAYDRFVQDAAAIPPGSGGVIVLPYFAGERNPYWNAGARAVIAGLGLEHTRAHIARATLEGVAFCLADVWEILAEKASLRLPIRLTGGITHSPAWAQILADVLGAPLALTEAADASAVGAAILGLRALDLCGPLEEMAARVRPGVVLHPDPARHQIYRELHRQFQALYRDVFHGTALG